MKPLFTVLALVIAFSPFASQAKTKTCPVSYYGKAAPCEVRPGVFRASITRIVSMTIRSNGYLPLPGMGLHFPSYSHKGEGSAACENALIEAQNDALDACLSKFSKCRTTNVIEPQEHEYMGDRYCQATVFVSGR